MDQTNVLKNKISLVIKDYKILGLYLIFLLILSFILINYLKNYKDIFLDIYKTISWMIQHGLHDYVV